MTTRPGGAGSGRPAACAPLSLLVPMLLCAALAGGCNQPIPAAGTPMAQSASPAGAGSAQPPTPAPVGTPSPSPSAWPSVPGDEVEEFPPIARLLTADGQVVAGVLGGFDYRDTFSSAPWIAASALEAITLPDRRSLSVALLPGFAFDRWSLSYAAAADAAAEVVMRLDSGAGNRLEQASFDPPPAGEWVIEVQLTFPDGDGGAAFYWQVIVP